jgi:hypothetical protein
MLNQKMKKQLRRELKKCLDFIQSDNGGRITIQILENKKDIECNWNNSYYYDSHIVWSSSFISWESLDRNYDYYLNQIVEDFERFVG